MLFFYQINFATTFYINDNSTKGDIYTTIEGNDKNDGLTPNSPKQSIKSVYEIAQIGDTIIVDTGEYIDLSSNGALLFENSKKIKFIIANLHEDTFSKTPLPTEKKTNPEEFFIINDKPVERNSYLQELLKAGKEK